MWLCWLGGEMPLEQTWRYYLRRFAVDHWNAFASGYIGHFLMLAPLNKPSGGVNAADELAVVVSA